VIRSHAGFWKAFEKRCLDDNSLVHSCTLCDSSTEAFLEPGDSDLVGANVIAKGKGGSVDVVVNPELWAELKVMRSTDFNLDASNVRALYPGHIPDGHFRHVHMRAVVMRLRELWGR